MKVVIVSGGFDPLHSGHIAYLSDAGHLGDKLIVALNSDAWLTRKKGRPFMSFEERACIIDRLDMVDSVWGFDDSDGSVCKALEQAKKAYPSHEIIFCNGGDRTKNNIPEMAVEGIEFIFGVGSENKSNSSSWILKEWKYPTERRVWGEYKVVHEEDEALVKLLIIEVDEEISYQRHFYRGEIWHIIEGQAMVKTSRGRPQNYQFDYLTSGQHFSIIPYEWHQVKNVGKVPLRIIEIQHGSYIGEDDIEREEILH